MRMVWVVRDARLGGAVAPTAHSEQPSEKPRSLQGHSRLIRRRPIDVASEP